MQETSWETLRMLQLLTHFGLYLRSSTPLFHVFVQLGGEAALLGTLSCIRRQRLPDWDSYKDIKNESIKHVNNFLCEIEQARPRKS